MPHSSKKNRKRPDQPGGSRTSLIIVVIVIIVIVAAGGGYYAYSAMKSTSTTSSAISGTYLVTTVSLNTSTHVTMNETLVNGTTYVIYATMATSKGNIELELFPQVAPKSVANFVNLARSGFYNNLLFHRIVPGFVIQAGDPTTKESGGVPGGSPSTWGQNNGPVNLPLETSSTLHNTVGTIALANTGAADSSGSQFYINLADNSASLDGKYTVFGKVISGMNVVTAISQVTPIDSSTGAPTSSSAYVFITSINILTNGP